MLINDKVDAVYIPDSPSRIKATDYNQIKNEIQECITLAGLTPTKDVIQLPQALKTLTQQSGAEEVAKIEAAGKEQLDAVNTAGAQAVHDAQEAANTATSKATEAAESAGEAASSASAAASSATEASRSAITATTQATNAADSASSANASASQATTKATEASDSASSAAQSAIDAAQSAQNSRGLSVGAVYYSQSSLASENPGALPLFTGETISSANTIYPDFYNWVLSHTELQCTSEEYESALSTYGECAKYVIGGGSLRLPLIKNYIKAANPSEGIKNIEAGLPDHTHYLATSSTSGTWGGGEYLSQYGDTGGAASYQLMGTSNEIPSIFKSSEASNPIYGKSSTVTPASTTLYPWVVAYASAIPASTAQAAEFQQGLSGKADTNLGNLSTAGKDLASRLGMPSNRYIDLTLGASGSTYTAPANGWFFLRKVSSGGSQVIYLTNTTNGMTSTSYFSVSGEFLDSIIPVINGQIIDCGYNTGGTTQFFRFIYAEGAE